MSKKGDHHHQDDDERILSDSKEDQVLERVKHRNLSREKRSVTLVHSLSSND